MTTLAATLRAPLDSLRKPKLLDLYCGAGGAAKGYQLAGFHVTGVDINPQPRYPFEFYQGDALAYVAAHGHEFDAIHASPPCEGHSRLTPISHKENYPDLIPATRFWLRTIGVPYVIENVPDAAIHLRSPLLLCGSMFGLSVFRHRYFECSWGLEFSPVSCRHDYKPVYISGSKMVDGKKWEFPVQQCRDAADIQWMTRAEIDKAIPPAYTEFIGRQLMRVLDNRGVLVR